MVKYFLFFVCSFLFAEEFIQADKEIKNFLGSTYDFGMPIKKEMVVTKETNNTKIQSILEVNKTEQIVEHNRTIEMLTKFLDAPIKDKNETDSNL